MNAARFDLGEMAEEFGEQHVRASHQVAGVGEELSIREVLAREVGER